MSNCTSPSTACDSTNESAVSTLNNFILAFFGSVTKTCVNGKVVWVLPCNLDAGLPGYPRLANEGAACYFLRIFNLFGLVASGAWSCSTLYHKNAFVTFNGAAYVALGDTLCNQPDVSPAFWQLYVSRGPIGPPGASPLTTKGDIFGFDVSDARIPVGADNTALMADSTQALGVRWGYPPSSDLATNLGAGDGVFALKAGNVFQFKSLIAGTNITITPTGTDLTIAAPGVTGVFTQSFVSAQQVIVAAGLLTIAHGLTSIPTLIQCELVCINADFGYSPGDIVLISNDGQDASFAVGVAVVPDATNINIRYGNLIQGAGQAFSILNYATGGPDVRDPVNWQFRVRAWA